MEIIKYPDDETIDKAVQAGEAMLAAVYFDEKKAVVGLLEDCLEHHILLMKAGLSDRDIDKTFRIVFDSEGADWTFVCPSDYKNIGDRTRRIASFYKDGFHALSEFLSELGQMVGIEIPKRYRRHLNALYE